MPDNHLYNDALQLLQQLIAVPSFSKEEQETAGIIDRYLQQKGVATQRSLNNIWAVNRHFDAAKPTILLNSHHDTVKPNPGYTRDPFQPEIIDGKLYGLGSNDAGGPLVSLIATFIHFYEQENLTHNLVLATTAEEEISGANGIEQLWSQLPPIAAAIVGEPTLTQLAIAEKGLLVLDCEARGRAGHAAREEGDNALYKAMDAINWFRTYQFPKVSATLGPVKMSVTSIETPNKAHNVVPDTCRFVVDIRVTDSYTHEEVLQIIRENVTVEVNPRSTRLRSSSIAADHPLVKAGTALGRTVYGSPTSSDAALMPVPVLKCGPGDSARSHTADEFIYCKEIEEGIATYIGILTTILNPADHETLAKK